jgi:hypothetical protein
MPSFNGDRRSLPDGHEELIDLDDDAEPAPLCAICQSEKEWIECFECGGEGEFDWETLQDEDPLWYGPDDTERCSACNGKGGWWECLNVERHPQEHHQ